jgi:hypothetical protein
MTLSDLSFIFDIISAVGVISSVLYLGYQIHQNTKAIRRSVSRDIVHDLNEFGRFFIEMPDIVEIFLASNEKPESLTAGEQLRLQVLMTNLFSNFDLALDYHRDGLLDEASITTYAQNLAQLMNNPVVKEWWQSNGKDLYSEELHNLVNKPSY